MAGPKILLGFCPVPMDWMHKKVSAWQISMGVFTEVYITVTVQGHPFLKCLPWYSLPSSSGIASTFLWNVASCLSPTGPGNCLGQSSENWGKLPKFTQCPHPKDGAEIPPKYSQSKKHKFAIFRRVSTAFGCWTGEGVFSLFFRDFPPRWFP